MNRNQAESKSSARRLHYNGIGGIDPINLGVSLSPSLFLALENHVQKKRRPEGGRLSSQGDRDTALKKSEYSLSPDFCKPRNSDF